MNEMQNLEPYLPYLMIVLSVWDIVWRGKALWIAAQKKETNWFIALLVINSVGILPIIYLKFFSKIKKTK